MLLFLPIFISTTYSLPNPTHHHRQTEAPDSTCPENWQFDLLSFSGPGCPDSSPTYNRTGHYQTSPDWGSHFVPGCALQWSWFSFPWLQGYISDSDGNVYLGGEKRNNTWCDVQIKYREMKGTFAPFPVKKGEEEFKLVMHGNGTTVEGKYGLDEGVSAVWRVTYLSVGETKRPLVRELIDSCCVLIED